MIYPDETMLYAPVEWNDCSEGYTDILYEKSTDGIAKITINRPQVRNAFRPVTVKEMIQALADARYDDNIGVIILTGAGDKAFCAGGDQKVRGDYGGYQDDSGVHHLNVLDFQRQIRTCPKPVVAMVAGYSIGGGHVLHMMCDLTIAAENAIFGQTGPKVGSFDGGWGASYMARIVGQKKAREIWFLCRQYDAKQALDMGLVNTVVPLVDMRSQNNGQMLAAMLEATSLAIQPDLRVQLKTRTFPFYYLCGERDDKFRALAAEISVPNHVIRNAGHNAHRDNPAGVVDCLAQILRR